MASPQKEKGYTAIANEILEAMAKIKLSPTQYRILFVVWRYTYGFNRKEHELSLSFLSVATNCDKRQLQRELKSLDEKKIIIQDIKSGAYRKIRFNKNYSKWLGETDNGETDNGETDIGEIVNTTIGEIVNTTIGETDNQERKTKEKYKESIIALTDEESQFIKILSGIKDYPSDKEKDADMYKRLIDRYPNIDILLSIKGWAIGKLDKPLKIKDSPRGQINTWCGNDEKWGRNLKPIKPKNTEEKIMRRDDY